jgi:quinol monooxygenase YgiN
VWQGERVFAIVVRFDLLDSDAAARFDAMVADLLPQIAAHEPGTLTYVVHAVDDAPLSRIFYEVYSDRAAHQAHEAQPHTAAFLREKDTLLSGSRVDFLTPTSSARP